MFPRMLNIGMRRVVLSNTALYCYCYLHENCLYLQQVNKDKCVIIAQTVEVSLSVSGTQS